MHTMLFWLTLNGPMLELRVSDCREAAVWYESARAWAKRSGVAPNEPGYLCDWDGRTNDREDEVMSTDQYLST